MGECTLVSNRANGGDDGHEWNGFMPYKSGGIAWGGGVYNEGELRLVNCTLANNEANGGDGELRLVGSGGSAFGGGLSSERGEVSVVNCTFDGNAAVPGLFDVGRFAPEQSFGSSLSITNSILTLTNTILVCAPSEPNVWGAFVDGGHNISSDATPFSNPSSSHGLDPLLKPLSNNGGATPSIALAPGSPAVDAGDDAASPPIDQRGVGRPYGSRSDIGAFELTFPGPPHITTQPRSLTVGAGQTASFFVAADTLERAYQWRFNEADLRDETNSTLLLPDVQVSQAGEYVVVVTNSFGAISSIRATLTVLPPTPPVILSQPQSQLVPEGRNLYLAVIATNLLPLEYQWRHDRTNTVGATNAILAIDSASTNDAGIYTVLVSTKFLSVTSSPAILTVGSALLPSILIQPKDVQVNEGSEANFSVLPAGGPPFTYQWQFEGIDLPGATNSSLGLGPLSIARAGNYTVKVSNSLGAVMSEQAALTVKPCQADLSFIPPKFDHVISQVGVQHDGKVLALSEGTLVRLNSDGSFDQSFVAAVGGYRFLLQDNDKILISGPFTSVGSVPREYLARLNCDGTLDPDFDSGSLATGSSELCLQPDGAILLKQSFSGPLLRLKTNGSLDAILIPRQSSFLRTFLALANGEVIFASGDFPESVLLLRLDSQGYQESGFRVELGPGPGLLSAEVSALVLQPDGKLLVGGRLTVAQGDFAVTNLARINADSSLDTTFEPAPAISSAPFGVYAVAVNRVGKIFIGGSFPEGLLRLNEDGSMDGTYQLDAQANSLNVQNDGRIIIGGPFSQVEGLARKGIARLFDPTTAIRITDFYRVGPIVRLAVTTLPNKEYVMERSPIPGASWERIQTVVGDGQKRLLTDKNASGAQAFYRVRME